MSDVSLVLSIERPDTETAQLLIQQLDADLLQRYPGQWIHGLHLEDFVDPELVFVVARLGSQPIGCGALRRLAPGLAEVKRMFVVPPFRRRGFSRQILLFLESTARRAGYTTLRLETGTRQPESTGLYQSAGYYYIPPYGEYVGNPFSLSFEKKL